LEVSVSNLGEFQKQVSELLLRHRSLLDILSKCDQSNASVHRSVIKAVTECGCIEVQGKKQPYSPEMTVEEAQAALQSHVSGNLCDQCAEVVSEQLGKSLFYLSALCNVLDVNLEKVIEDESKKCNTLGIFKMA
jgi:hypothetical protein